MNPHMAEETLRWIWLAWILYWFGSALGVPRTVRREPIWQRMSTIVIMVVAVLLLGLLDQRWAVLEQRFVPDTDWVRWAGLVATVAGLAFSVWARRHLGRFWSARVGLKENHELIQSGPYAWVRHPIYTGILLGTIGSALVVGEYRALAAVALVWIGLIMKARREENLLSQEFGEAFVRYRERTGWLLPKISG
jgi:protein-S-isoprenylcysteine O-methyltransferase Ste14